MYSLKDGNWHQRISKVSLLKALLDESGSDQSLPASSQQNINISDTTQLEIFKQSSKVMPM